MAGNQFLLEMGKRIADRRKELHITQEQLAEKVSLSLQSVSCIELGKKAVRPDNLLHICTALDISPDYILSGRRTAEQLDGIMKKLTALDDSDFAAVEQLIDHLLGR